MGNRVVLFDLDLTLIDREYRTTCPIECLRGAITDAQLMGWLIGFHSDTPLSTLQAYAHEFGMHGPIIAERGVVVFIPEREPISTVPNTEDFHTILGHLVATVRLDPQWMVQLGDARDFRRFSEEAPPNGKNLLFVNNARTHSIAFWVRRSVGGAWTIDVGLLRTIVDRLIAVGCDLPVWQDQMMDVNPAYGICIINHRLATKTRGYQALRSVLPAGCRVFMIGDGESDIIDDPAVVHCAVANAVDALKARAAYISPEPITRGAIDILRWIQQQ